MHPSALHEVGRLASLAHTALSDPGALGLIEDGAEEDETRAITYALEQLRDIIAVTDPDEFVHGPGSEPLGITFDGDASESFASRVEGMAQYYVRITPIQGEPFDAIIIGSDQDTEVDGDTWFDAVRCVEADEESGLQIEGAEPKTVRVRNVHIY
jgi:hypothetical protein